MFRKKEMKKKKILIVDDEQDIREMLADFFASVNIPCDVAGNSRAALSLLSRKRYSLILLDYNLEREKAPDVAGRIRDKSGSVPLVMLTGSPDLDEAEKAKLDAADWIFKPFKFDRVMAVVNRYLESK